MTDEQTVALMAAIIVAPMLAAKMDYQGMMRDAAIDAQNLFDAVRQERKRRYTGGNDGK